MHPIFCQRCLEDLKSRFAKVEIEVSPPLVAFRETITSELARGGFFPIEHTHRPWINVLV